MDCSWKTRLARPCALLALALAVILSAAEGQSRAAAPGRYAGIEVGAKGVKVVVLDVGPSGATPLLESVSNTTLAQGVAKSGVFSAGAVRETAAEAGKFADRVREEFHVPSNRVTVFGSSGLPKASNRDELVKAVADSSKLPSMTFISAAEEVKMSVKGSLTSEADRADGMLVDVGSGNTKGGFLRDGGVLDFNVPFGSVTFENRVAIEAKEKKQPFPETADQLRTTLLEPELARQVEARPELRERKTVFLSGGAAYALATLTKSEAASQKQVELSAKDIAAYAQMVHSSPIKVPEIDAKANPTAAKEVKNILDVFTPTNLIAGSELLTALSSALDFEHKTLRFDRSSLFALSRGKILQLAENTPDEPPAPAPPVYPSSQSLPQ